MKKKELDDDKTFRDEIDNLVTLQDALFQLVKSPAKTFSPNVSESEIEKTKLVYTIGPNTIMKKNKRKMKGFDKKENTILFQAEQFENIEELEKKMDQMMKSEGAKKFQCLTCGKISSKRSHMREHIEIHFEGLNFPCHICDKPFTSRASLRNHHTMKRCTGFDSIKDLDRKICEMMKRESDKRFRCLTCGKMAKNRGHMQEHIEQHIEGLNIPCPQCEKSFRSRGSRRKHIRNLHSPC